VLALELYLDEASERSVLSLWAALDALGVPSLGSAPGAAYRPHVSLAVFAETDLPGLVAALGPALFSCPGLPLTLASLGFFVGAQSVAFLGVTPTERLLDTHRNVHAALVGVTEESWPVYEPGAWVPHCTLAMNLNDPARVLAGFTPSLPIPASTAGAHIVEISSGRSIVQLV
jgi:hypothetical protein